jgi:hypothetical protein
MDDPIVPQACKTAAKHGEKRWPMDGTDHANSTATFEL